MENNLGLAERRAIKDYQETIFTEVKKNLMSAITFETELDVKWEQLAKTGQADVYKEDSYWGITIFRPLIAAISSITSDDIGKDALKSKLKKIIVMHDADTAPASNYANGVSWQEGVLTINFTPYSNADEGSFKERVSAIQKLLESNL